MGQFPVLSRGLPALPRAQGKALSRCPRLSPAPGCQPGEEGTLLPFQVGLS